MEEKIYECEVKRLFIRNGEKVRDWKRVSVTEALDSAAGEVRCAECHGAVGLHGRLRLSI
jgi:formylmethanofuran dehydrogenase subunit E